MDHFWFVWVHNKLLICLFCAQIKLPRKSFLTKFFFCFLYAIFGPETTALTWIFTKIFYNCILKDVLKLLHNSFQLQVLFFMNYLSTKKTEIVNIYGGINGPRISVHSIPGFRFLDAWFTALFFLSKSKQSIIQIGWLVFLKKSLNMKLPWPKIILMINLLRLTESIMRNVKKR